MTIQFKKRILKIITAIGVSIGIAVSYSAVAATLIPGKIEAEAYTSMSGIALENASEGTQNVGWIDTGDWLVYSITVPTTGSYILQYRVASPNSNTAIAAEYNAAQLGSVNIPNTGGWQNWTTVFHTVNLPAGTYSVRVYAKTGGFNLNWIHISANTLTPLPSPPQLTNPAADAALIGYLNAFMASTGNATTFKRSLADSNADTGRLASLDILALQDAYERTGNAAQKAIIDNLCRTWLQQTPTPWNWNNRNDDIGWFSLALVHGHQITGKAEYLAAAKYGFDTAWTRGWDTTGNTGGIWTQQPDSIPDGSASKGAISNNSLGKVAVLLYQSIHDQWYLNRAIQIHDWVVHHLYDANSGQVYSGVDNQNRINTDIALSNQGIFTDFSHLLYLVTGDSKYEDYARKAIDYAKANITDNGIISASDEDAGVDEMARGLGHVARDSRLWDTYYSWMQQNAAAIWQHRRTDYNITWNNWAEPTPTDNGLLTSKFAGAVAWMQFTPASKPGPIGGIHSIVSKQNGIAIDSAGLFADGTGAILGEANASQNQKWLFTQNEDSSWNIVSTSSWKALDVSANNPANGSQIILWSPTRNNSQRWWVDLQADGSYRITNKVSGGALDNSGYPQNGYKLIQWNWNGGEQQRWLLQ